jgi:ribosome biogenesis GTPase A
MANFWELVNRVIRDADVILLLLDARLVEKTRNEEIEDKVRKAGKVLIYVITKSDLVDKQDVEKYKKTLKPCVFVSAVKHHGTTILRERILIEAHKAKVEEDKRGLIKVGVLGYPNVGKSTLINALSGKRAAPTSSISGYTKGVQNVKADNRIVLIDTPGVIPYLEKDLSKHAAIGTIDYSKIKDPDVTIMDLMIEFPGKIERYCGVEVSDDKEETLEKIATKRNLLMKGSRPDVIRAAKILLKDWQEGKIR